MVEFEAIERGEALEEFRDKHLFNSLARPWRLSQKRQARFDRRVMTKAADRHTRTKFRPAVPCD
jgi:hypothetical protein